LGLGSVTQEDFEKVCQQSRVRTISKNDLKRISILYPAAYINEGEDQRIDYLAMSKDMGLHAPSLNLISKQNKRHYNLSRLREFMNSTSTTA